MSTSRWEHEAKRFAAMTPSEREQWLARLLFILTVLARETYTVGEEGLDDPVRMRRFNELMHRTSSQLRASMDKRPGRPDESFLIMVQEEMVALNIEASDLFDMWASG